MRKFLLIMACGLLVGPVAAMQPHEADLESDSDDDTSQVSLADILLQNAYETETAHLRSAPFVQRLAFNLDEIINLGLYKNFTAALHAGEMQVVGQYLNIQSIRERLCKINRVLVSMLIAVLYEQAPQPRWP